MTAHEMLSVARARTTILAACRPTATEVIPIAEAHGRFAAQAMAASFGLPRADVSVMDGYAVRSADIGETGADPVLTVVSESAAGHPSAGSVVAGTVARISTGAVIPAGADAVVAQEDTTRDGNRVRIHRDRLRRCEPGTFIRPASSELTEGEALVVPGTRVTAGHLALLGATGHATIAVHRRPRVAIVSNGDELIPVGQVPDRGQVVSTNGLMLAAALRATGAEVVTQTDVGDDPAILKQTLADAMTADIVITSGGISVGDHDLVYQALADLGASFGFRALALRPGKPTTFATVGDTLVFALPGNPAATWVTAALLVAPAVAACQADPDPGPPVVRVRAACAVPGAGRRAHYVRARLRDGLATVLSVQASGNLRSIAGVDGLIRVPANVPQIPKGAPCDMIMMGPLA